MPTPEKQQSEQSRQARQSEQSEQQRKAAGPQSQLQSASAEKEQKAKTAEQEAEKSGETQFFDTTITKITKDEEGNEIEVMSDHLDPGEKLKSAVEAEKAEEKLKASRKERSEQDPTRDRKAAEQERKAAEQDRK